jgi:hypothetical protein
VDKKTPDMYDWIGVAVCILCVSIMCYGLLETNKLKFFADKSTDICSFIGPSLFTGLKLEEQLRTNKLLNAKRFIEVSSQNCKNFWNYSEGITLKGRKLKTPDALIMLQL